MAKTRIKTTPTRLQKGALMASSATTAAAITKPGTTTATTCHIATPQDDAKKRLRHSASLANSVQSGGSSTIIVTAPKRTNSISSVASSISQISDAHSDNESPPPQTALTMSTSTTTTTTTAKPTKSLFTSHVSSQAPRTLNSLLCKPTNAIATLRNRKVFMITEKSDEPGGAETSTMAAGGGGSTTGQKRKMYLIMEENSCPEDGEAEEGGNFSNDVQKYVKRENGLIVGAGGSKKLTLFANKADSGALTEKFEKILPEILHRIQAKDTSAAPLVPTSKLLNGSTANLNIVKSEPIQPQQQQNYLKKTTEVTNERLPITLPPKKNRTKIITTHSNSSYNISYNGSNQIVNSFSDNFKSDTASIWENFDNSSGGSSSSSNNHKIGTQCQIKQISAATPVIVSAVNVAARNNNHNKNNCGPEIKRFAPHNSSHNVNNNTNIRYASNCSNGQATTNTAQVELVPHKNINLSTDFHFLIKMLPKLESIPEPHKNNVKNCIERIITQNANIFAKQK